MRRTGRAYLRFVCAMIGVNLRAALAYRVSFVTNMLFMAINDGMWIVFWSLFFARFPIIRGWELRDIATVWAVVATGVGLASGIFGNCRPLGARTIAEGRLDYHLSVPKNPLLHFLLSSMSVAAWGDTLFGILCYVLVVHPDPAHLALFLVFGLNVCVIMVSVGTLVNAMAFYTGNSEGLAMQFTNAVITFSTYPLDLFATGVKVLLFTAIPAGFVSYLPVRLLRDFDWLSFASMQAFTAAIAIVAVTAFYRGLRRYESGSLVTMKS